MDCADDVPLANLINSDRYVSMFVAEVMDLPIDWSLFGH